MTTTEIVIVILAVIVVALLAWHFLRERRSKMLRSRFGPEYDHAVTKYGSQSQAEEALLARQRRLEKLDIHSLNAAERDRFTERWRSLQSHFVDDPSGSIQDADALVSEVMRARGYPMSEFEHRAEDLSVQYPQVVISYRAAHAIAMKREEGKATTEELRQGLVYYRELFEELCRPPALEPEPAHPAAVESRSTRSLEPPETVGSRSSDRSDRDMPREVRR